MVAWVAKKAKGFLKKKDNNKHKLIAQSVSKDLKKVEKKDISYLELRKKKEQQAKKLEKINNSKLKKPVVIKITFPPIEKDRKDNDLDYKIYIGPNDYIENNFVKAGPESVKPEVDEYKTLKGKTGSKNQEAHHVPPKGLLNWISKKAILVIEHAKKHGLEKDINDKYPWINSIAKMDKKTHTPGDNLAAISINKYTHIKKIGDSNKEVWRVHFGKETAKEVYKRMKDKGLVLIYIKKFNELSEEDKAEFREHAQEAGEVLPTANSSEFNSSEGEFVSTQFFQKELNAAGKKEKAKWHSEALKFKMGIGTVAKGAAYQAHLAVTVALEKSDRDGTKKERKSAINKLKGKSKETWNKVDGVNQLNIFN
jgi:hypothetical protein